MTLLNKKIMITGADGFIGSHLVEYLVGNNYSVKAFTCYNSFGTWGWLDTLDSETLKSCDVVMGDVRDSQGVKKNMQGCDVVLHLAALIGIPYSYHSPETYIDTNVKGTLNIVQAARELGVEKLVHTSTSEVYGSARYVPIDEEHPLQGQSPYSASKIGADQLAMSFFNSFETPVSIVRPFNTFGPRQSARAFIPTVISQIAAGQKVIKLGALQPTRDLSFVMDTVKGFEAVAKSEKTVGQVLNLGSNFEISMLETVQLIAKIMNVTIEIEEDVNRIRPLNSEVDRLWADTKKVQRLTDWQPNYAGREGFIRGLKETIDWFVIPENLKLYKPFIYNI